MTIMKTLLEFKKIADALHGSGGYENGAYLVKYDSETDDQYSKRRAVAWFANELFLACDRFVGYISKRPPNRTEIKDARLLKFVDDCNWRGDSLDVFWQSFMIEAKARGSMLVLVDMPQEIPSNAQSQLDQRAFPYLVTIKPEELVDFSVDKRGRLTMVEIKDMLDDEPVIRGWDEEKWYIKKDDQIIKSNNHGLGLCPVLAFTEMNDFPALGGFSSMEPIIKRLYNIRSELDEILRRHTFPIFSAQFPLIEPSMYLDPGTAQTMQAKMIGQLQEGIKKLGAERGIVSPGSVGFVAPPDGPATTLQNTIKELEEKINEIGLKIDMTGERTAESGLALTIRFQALNAALTRFARRMEDLERRVFDVASRWLKIDTEAITEWGKDYELADPEREIAILQQMQAAALPEEVIKKQMKTVINAQFSTADPEEVDELNNSVDEFSQERPLPAEPTNQGV